MNLLEADVERSGDELVLVLGSQRLQIGAGVPRALADYAGRRVIVGIRPEGLEDAAFDEHRDTQQSLTAQVELREALGSEIVLHLRIDAAPAQTEETRELAQDVGNERAAGDQEVGPARRPRGARRPAFRRQGAVRRDALGRPEFPALLRCRDEPRHLRQLRSLS